MILIDSTGGGGLRLVLGWSIMVIGSHWLVQCSPIGSIGNQGSLGLVLGYILCWS